MEETTTDQSSKGQKTVKNRFYSLYLYKVPRDDRTSENESGQESTDENLSESISLMLTVLATDLTASVEMELRKFLCLRVLKKFVYSDEGCITSLEYNTPSEDKVTHSCYYCMLENAEDKQLSINIESVDTRKYILCFLSPHDNILDQHEIDIYSKGLVKHLDMGVCCDLSMSQENGDQSQLTNIDTSVHEYLERWPDVTMDYMCRCMRMLEHNVKFLLHGALIGARLQIEGSTENQKEDILRFMKACNLSDILSQSHHDKREASPASTGSLDMLIDLGEMNTPTQVQPVLNIQISGNDVTCTPQTCTRYCDEWGKILNKADKKRAAQIMQAVEAFKIKYIQSINTLKRLLIQADTDYYALYKSYVFMKNSGNSNILLNYSHLDCVPEVEGVVKSLREFIQEAV